MIVTVFSLKGGCGKTTICTSLAVACLLQSRRILLVDADQQQQSLTAWRGRRLAKGRAIPITSDTQNIREQMRAEQCAAAWCRNQCCASRGFCCRFSNRSGIF